MDAQPFTLLEPVGAVAPLVVDSPHSGRVYPADFDFICPLSMLRQTEDFLIDELVASAAQAGATVVAAEFPRSYIDVNRAENDIDPAVLAEGWDAPLELTERTALGLGLVRRLCMTGVPVYSSPLSVSEVRRRIEAYYRPYHDALTKTIDRRLKLFGIGHLLDCHSMPSRSQGAANPHRADFVLGDRNGTSCDPSFTCRVRDLLHEAGYSVALNEPYKGMEIVRRHGRPEAGRHALQIEINRRLYMDERKLEKNAGFAHLQKALSDFFAMLAADLSREAATPMAAE